MSRLVILSNGLTDRPDEGFLNVANNLVKRIKQKQPDTLVVSYERQAAVTDRFLTLNKCLLNRSLFSLLRRERGRVLHIPFPAKAVSTAVRLFILSLLAGKRVQALLVMKSEYPLVARLLLRFSGAQVLVLSAEAADFYRTILPEKRVVHLRAGVDCKRFTPVSTEHKRKLKEQYGFDPDRPVVLHVGHLKKGRGVGELLKLNPRYQVVLVTSTLTASEQDAALRQQLTERDNVRLITEYLPHIEEVYQLSDVYFFPTVASCHCIDIPLSCMEAAACGISVVTTDYGEMKAFAGKDGFWFIGSFAADALNALVEQAIRAGAEANSREAVSDYDWDNAVSYLTE
ncbi:MAG: glycosyltransferase family 4 protein [Clostridia bacterium]|nr:glycosyltransferase family 4 protein [Clostridia bacterium]